MPGGWDTGTRMEFRMNILPFTWFAWIVICKEFLVVPSWCRSPSIYRMIGFLRILLFQNAPQIVVSCRFICPTTVLYQRPFKGCCVGVLCVYLLIFIIRMNNHVTFFNTLASQECLQFPCTTPQSMLNTSLALSVFRSVGSGRIREET